MKIILIGESSVGKSSILKTYSENSFDPDSLPTIGIEFKTKLVAVTNGDVSRGVKQQIFDTAGQERFHTVTRNFYRRSNGIIVVYDVQNRESFRAVEKWIQDVTDNMDEKDEYQMILVGNKNDHSLDFHNKQVSTEEMNELAKRFSIPAVEVSAKDEANKNKTNSINQITKSGIENLFYNLAKDFLAKIDSAAATNSLDSSVIILNKDSPTKPQIKPKWC